MRVTALIMSKSHTNLIYHLVFSTKDRLPIITLRTDNVANDHE